MRHALPEGRQAGAARFLHSAFADHESALPIVATVDQDCDAACSEAAHGLGGIARFRAQAKPEHIHRGSEIFSGKTGAGANRRMAPVAADGKVGTDLERPIGRLCADAGDAAALLDEIERFGAHVQVEGGKLPRVGSRVKSAKAYSSEEGTDGRCPLVGKPEKLIEQAELAHELER